MILLTDEKTLKHPPKFSNYILPEYEDETHDLNTLAIGYVLWCLEKDKTNMEKMAA